MSVIQSLSRGLTVLELLSRADNGLSVTELSAELGVDKSSVTRLLQTLVQHQFAVRDTYSRRYLLGSKMHELVGDQDQAGPLKTISKPILEGLVEETGENAHVAVYSEGLCLVVEDVVSSIAQLQVVSGVGRMIPNHCTAIGKCLIAFGDYPLPKELTSFTPRTIVTRDQLKLHLEQVRMRGYALDDEEHEYGVRCLAAPVFDSKGELIASIGISGPTVRVTLERVLELAQVVIDRSYVLSDALESGA